MRHALAIVRLSGFIVALAATGCLSSEAAESNSAESTEPGETSSAMKLLAEVNLEHGRQVKFLEPVGGGGIAILETGRLEHFTTAPRPDMTDVVAYYESLTGEKAPAALREVMEHSGPGVPRDKTLVPREIEATVVPTQGAGLSGTTDNAAVGVTKQALSNNLTHEQFKAAYCTQSLNEWFNWTDVNGSGSFQWNDIHRFNTAAFAVNGSVQFSSKYRPWYTWNNIAIGAIPAGSYLAYYVSHYFESDFDAKASVTDDNGVLYSFCSQKAN
jgi:hypothetical protein